jgi:aldehyde dehydrogenase (NAD+)
MQETQEQQITRCLKNQKTFFLTHKTKEVAFRIAQLKKLKEVLLINQTKIEQAIWQDLHKSPEEVYLTEFSMVIHEIDYHIKNLKKWSRPKNVATPLHLLPSSSKIMYEPLGVSLIVAPWNYPFQLLFNPLIGSISAGCCSILKPSPETPTIAKLMETIISETFNPNYIAIFQGATETNTILFKQKFDFIFFTGSSRLGKIVMQAAAENLTPVLLELGGKSPCIVDAEANIDIAAKRITWGKFINAGQTCIAPDYLFVHQSIKNELVQKIKQNINEMYGYNPKNSRFYGRIINAAAMERLQKFLAQGKIITGRTVDLTEKYIAPTIVENVMPEDLIMQEEIFGPILPILTYENIDQALDYINENDKPLAFYYFGENKKAKEILQKVTSGGACINDTLMHISNHNLPFGGVGNSGIGKYHGKASFYAFSNLKSIVTSPTWIDFPLKYVPYQYFKSIKKII